MPSPLTRGLRLHIATIIVLILASSTSETVAQRAPSSSPAASPASSDVDSIAAVLPDSVRDLERVSLQTTAGPLPSSPQPPAALRPLLRFLPEALMEVDLATDSLSGVWAKYEGGPRPIFVAIIDYSSRPSQLDSAYRRLAADGHATETTLSINGTEFPGFEGTGTSDDVVPPHGVKALVGKRFEVVVAEQVPQGVSSITDFDALPAQKLRRMVDRARALLEAVDLRRLATLTHER